MSEVVKCLTLQGYSYYALCGPPTPPSKVCKIIPHHSTACIVVQTRPTKFLGLLMDLGFVRSKFINKGPKTLRTNKNWDRISAGRMSQPCGQQGAFGPLMGLTWDNMVIHTLDDSEGKLRG